MKTLTRLLMPLIPLSFMGLAACEDRCEIEATHFYYEPVYTSWEELRASVKFETPRPINQHGKIYFINDYVLINEPNVGIHFINNTDRGNPENVGFLSIPGNFDMAANQQYLYVDSYTDLVIIDISNMRQPQEANRMQNVFTNYNSYGFYPDPELGVVSEWREASFTQTMPSDCEGNTDWTRYHDRGIFVDYALESSADAVSPSNPGMGGSMARFTIAHERLYSVDISDLQVVDLSNPLQPVVGRKTALDWGIETIFPYQDKLFIGANNGMWIYDISSPDVPEYLSRFTHETSCDPVVTDGQYAYVTLRSGTECNGFTNQLEVIDIVDPRNPERVAVYPMYNPHGLAVDGTRLYICDGQEGLKVYNKSDVMTIDQHLIHQYPDMFAYDVIAFDCHVMLIASDGLHQYTCQDNLLTLQYVSTIPFASL